MNMMMKNDQSNLTSKMLSSANNSNNNSVRNEIAIMFLITRAHKD